MNEINQLFHSNKIWSLKRKIFLKKIKDFKKFQKFNCLKTKKFSLQQKYKKLKSKEK
jgi:hypothetical protein